MYLILIAIIILLLGLAAFLYLRTSRILKRLDEMLDSAADGTFQEKDFSETRMSRLEAKMYRYLTAGETSRSKIEQDRSSIKALVSDISHQTKTPIANILLYSELLGEKPLDADARRLLENISGQSAKLSFLIRSLVKISRLENGIMELAPRENQITDLLQAADISSAAQQKGIQLQLDAIPDLSAVFDLKWTAEALSNILDNAVKYTPSGGRVTVSAREYELFVRIDVADTGIGIDEAETAKIFSRFYRSPDVRDERGVGIGLYLAREIITREGGYIKVTSEKSRGSLFSIFLPRTAPGQNLSTINHEDYAQ